MYSTLAFFDSLIWSPRSLESVTVLLYQIVILNVNVYATDLTFQILIRTHSVNNREWDMSNSVNRSKHTFCLSSTLVSRTTRFAFFLPYVNTATEGGTTAVAWTTGDGVTVRCPAPGFHLTFYPTDSTHNHHCFQESWGANRFIGSTAKLMNCLLVSVVSLRCEEGGW